MSEDRPKDNDVAPKAAESGPADEKAGLDKTGPANDLPPLEPLELSAKERGRAILERYPDLFKALARA